MRSERKNVSVLGLIIKVKSGLIYAYIIQSDGALSKQTKRKLKKNTSDWLQHVPEVMCSFMIVKSVNSFLFWTRADKFCKIVMLVMLKVNRMKHSLI